ncbi:MAG TPA: site-specific integrase [Thermoplasmata archaeon]|nr:site-specific integrase [Thermoplasmata archaeon]
MTRPREVLDVRFADLHLVRRGIDHRLDQLKGQGPIGEVLELDRTNREAIIEFVESRRGTVGDLRIRTYLAWLPAAAQRLGGAFLEPKRGIQEDFSRAFPRAKYSRSSREGAAHCLTTFWRWRFDRLGRDFPPWLRIRLERWTPTSGAADMLSREEVAALAEHALNFRDKAWIWTLFNSGCRPGEIYRLTVGDVVSHDEGYIELLVRREKGSAPEPAPIYEDAVPALLAWLASHPRRGEPDAPLWVDMGGSRTGRVATYRAMYKAIETAARRANLKKPVSAYGLRRSRLTLLAKDPAISTSILERVAGWVPGSRVARHYVHLSGKDVINALNARYGVMSPGPRSAPAMPRTPLKCGRCKTVNPPGAAYCMTCGGPLSLPAVRQIEEARGAEEKLAELLRNPEAVEFLAKLLSEGEKGKSRGGRDSASGDEESPIETTPLSAELSSGPRMGLRPPGQKVVPLSDAEGWIQSGYEFVAVLGADRAVLRAPRSS